MKVVEEFFKPVLETLYSVYPSFIDLEKLTKEAMKKTTHFTFSHEKAKGVCLYLKDRGLIVESAEGWRIAASGINSLEKRALLKPDPVEPSIFIIK